MPPLCLDTGLIPGQESMEERSPGGLRGCRILTNNICNYPGLCGQLSWEVQRHGGALGRT
jgi:hypothetical protein